MKRCELTTLFEDQCAHCKGQTLGDEKADRLFGGLDSPTEIPVIRRPRKIDGMGSNTKRQDGRVRD